MFSSSVDRIIGCAVALPLSMRYLISTKFENICIHCACGPWNSYKMKYIMLTIHCQDCHDCWFGKNRSWKHEKTEFVCEQIIAIMNRSHFLFCALRREVSTISRSRQDKHVVRLSRNSNLIRKYASDFRKLHLCVGMWRNDGISVTVVLLFSIWSLVWWASRKLEPRADNAMLSFWINCGMSVSYCYFDSAWIV